MKRNKNRLQLGNSFSAAENRIRIFVKMFRCFIDISIIVSKFSQLFSFCK